MELKYTYSPCSNRNKCAACTLIANDIDATKRAMHSSLSLRSILASDEKSYCDALGYKHMPYAWIEEVCEEMLEEKLGTHTICNKMNQPCV